MSEENALSPREKEILRLFAILQRVSADFSTKTRSELALDGVEADLSPSVLNIAQAFSRTASPSDRDLFLLRDISLAIKNSPALRSITTLLVNEDYIAQTYKDMMSKRAVIEPDYKLPCNISRLLSLGSDAVTFGASRSYTPCDVSVFPSVTSATKRINCALNGYFSVENDSVFKRKDVPIRNQRRLSSCQAAIIYTRDEEKAGLLEEFCASSKNTLGAVDAFACVPHELFLRLLDKETGFSINADALPEINLLGHIPREYRAVIKTSLSFFSDIIFGRTAAVIIASKPKLDKISAIARVRGLSVCRAVTFKAIKDVTVSVQNRTAAKLGLSLILAIRDMIGHSAEITTHDPNAVSKDISVEKIFEDTNAKTAVYKAEVNVSSSPAPYHETLYTSLGLIARAAADGFRLKMGDFSFSVGASFSLTNSKNTGAAVASILGLYRIETEFCIPEENSSIEYSENESKLTIYLKAHSTQRASVLNEITSIEPLIFSDLDKNGFPDIDNLKKFACGEYNPNVIKQFEV